MDDFSLNSQISTTLCWSHTIPVKHKFKRCDCFLLATVASKVSECLFLDSVSNIFGFVSIQEVTATSRHYVDRLFDPDPQKVLQGVM